MEKRKGNEKHIKPTQSRKPQIEDESNNAKIKMRWIVMIIDSGYPVSPKQENTVLANKIVPPGLPRHPSPLIPRSAAAPKPFAPKRSQSVEWSRQWKPRPTTSLPDSKPVNVVATMSAASKWSRYVTQSTVDANPMLALWRCTSLSMISNPLAPSTQVNYLGANGKRERLPWKETDMLREEVQRTSSGINRIRVWQGR
ncbi:hypothetical protein MRB53_017120 [Persea americana]|uniref:Uncharacterized protein n=1 Tax=Persea americana TaxID=3435 RepID=A0ACC2M471_PERAE|nr:hypothetical protein MRB53_017120 [Persea americana]